MVRVAILGGTEAAQDTARALHALAGDAVLSGQHTGDGDGLGELLHASDAVVVATPPDRRTDDARRVLQAGLDVLVEPCDAEGLRELQAAAMRTGRSPVLGIAHTCPQEPALRTLRKLIGDGQVLSVEATHLEAFDDAPGHPDVTTDLLLGPLQAVLGIAGRPPAATQAAGRRVRRGQGLDLATATLCFDDDLIAVITVGRAGMRRVRRFVAETPQARVTADLLTGTVEAERDLPGRGVVVERLTATGPDARVAHLAGFLRACRDRRPPDVGLGVALGLLDVAETIRKRVDLVAHRPAARQTLRVAG